MSLVVLMSGGLDSSLVALLAQEQGLDVVPLFIDYGQRARDAELAACRRVCGSARLPDPVVMDVSGYGRAVPSGLTDPDLRINEDAFLPGRNLLFLLAGAALAHSRGASGVAIGLLDDRSRLFPDQTREFVSAAGHALTTAFGSPVHIVAPLIDVSKAGVIEMAAARGLTGTYSCHAGGPEPCGVCVSCVELIRARDTLGG